MGEELNSAAVGEPVKGSLIVGLAVLARGAWLGEGQPAGSRI